MYGQMPYPYGNPAMQNAQQRLQMMEAQYPQFAANYGQPIGQTPPPQSQTPAAPMLKGRPVSNEQEANAAMIDFDGSLFIFPDKAHGKIYTKQLGLDGNIIFERYSIDQPQEAAPMAAPTKQIDLSGYVKRSEVESLINELVEQRLSKIEQKPVNNNKGGNK